MGIFDNFKFKEAQSQYCHSYSRIKRQNSTFDKSL